MKESQTKPSTRNRMINIYKPMMNYCSRVKFHSVRLVIVAHCNADVSQTPINMHTKLL